MIKKWRYTILIIFCFTSQSCNMDFFNPDVFLQTNTFSNDKDSTKGSSTTAGNPSVDDEILPSHLNYSRILVYAEDDEGFTPVIGFNQSVPERYLIDNDGDGYSDDYLVAVSSNPIEPNIQTSKNIFNNFYDKYFKSVFNNSIIKGAFAKILDLDKDITTQGKICSQQSITCCRLKLNNDEVDQDVAFECYHPTQSEEKPLHLYITDGNKITQSIEEKSNDNFLWLRQEPKDQSKLNSDYDENDILATLGQDRLLQYYHKNGKFRVLGNYHDYYSTLEAKNTDQIAFDGDGVVSFRRNTEGIDVYDSFYADDYINLLYDSTTMLPDTSVYSFLKKSNDGQLRFLRNPLVPLKTEYIYHAIYKFAAINFLNQLLFDKDTDQLVLVKETSVFDVGDLDYALVVFKDQDDNYRLRVTHTSIGQQWGGKKSLGKNYEFIDLVAYYLDLSPNSNFYGEGRALLIDKLNNKIWMIEFSPVEDTVTDQLSGPINGISINSPQSITLNTDKTKAYVTSQNLDIIYILNLVEDNRPLTVADIKSSITEINLTDYLAGKLLSIKPNKLIFKNINNNDYLFLGSKDLKSTIAINLDEFDYNE